ncbi:MAG: inositol monophosphatase [Gluconacetobacter diazotrophicus]|nr:inositol monophosphatase [Gluconacetobacter diazotrophicus]
MAAPFTFADWERARALLCGLGDAIRDAVLAARNAQGDEQLAGVAAVTAADTIYAVDKVSEGTVLGWMRVSWPAEWPVELVMEGAGEDGEPLTFPRHTPPAQTILKLIIDPIDGTRGLMYDKRSAWALAGLAPQRGPGTGLRDIVAAAMTELPTTKQWRADQISAVRGGGPAGIVASSVNVLTGERRPLTVRPSRATDFQHGFASLAKFFPEGKALTAQIEEALWDRLHGRGRSAATHVFDDQYLATGGQIYERLMGHDRMLGDLRPLVLSSLGYKAALTCHPYDICAGLLLTEAGGVLEAPNGRPLDAPLNTTWPVAWMGYANEALARLARPVLWQVCEHYLASTWRNGR